MTWKRYKVNYTVEHCMLTSDTVRARTEKEAKAKIRKRYGRKVTGLNIDRFYNSDNH